MEVSTLVRSFGESPTEAIVLPSSSNTYELEVAQHSIVMVCADAQSSSIAGNRLPPQNEAILRDIFQQCDVSGDGLINKRELIKACRNHAHMRDFFGLAQHIRQEDGTRDAMEALFQRVDGDDNREWDWNEFRNAFADRVGGTDTASAVPPGAARSGGVAELPPAMAELGWSPPEACVPSVVPMLMDTVAMPPTQLDGAQVCGAAVATSTMEHERNTILAAVRRDGLALARAPEVFRSDRDVVLTAVRHSGWALEYAATALRGDRELVLAAVSETGYALEHASAELRCNRFLVLKAVAQNGAAAEFAAEELRADRDFMLECTGKNASAVAFAADELRHDREFAVEAVKRSAWALGHLPESMHKDSKVVLEAMKRNGRRWNPHHANCGSAGRTSWRRP